MPLLEGISDFTSLYGLDGLAQVEYPLFVRILSMMFAVLAVLLSMPMVCFVSIDIGLWVWRSVSASSTARGSKTEAGPTSSSIGKPLASTPSPAAQ